MQSVDPSFDGNADLIEQPMSMMAPGCEQQYGNQAEQEKLNCIGSQPDPRSPGYGYLCWGDGGIHAGAGLDKGKETDVIGANVSLGRWGEEGSERWGIKGSGGLVGFKTDQSDSPVNAEGQVAQTVFEASAGEDGATLGVGATAVGGGLTFGHAAGGGTEVRGGVSINSGIGVRAHWGDKDKNGHPEVGFGADVGFFSGDLKSEDPGPGPRR